MFSPIPLHKQIEVFHNLTRSPSRSPERQKASPTPEPKTDEVKSDSKDVVLYDSFQVCENKEENKEVKKNNEKKESTPPKSSPPIQALKIPEKKFINKSNEKTDTVVLPPLENSGSFQICESSEKNTNNKVLEEVVSSKPLLKDSEETKKEKEMEAVIHTIQGEVSTFL